MMLGTIYIVWIADDFLSVFMAFLIILGVPMAGWCGIFLCDLLMRRYPYDERALFGRTGDGTGYGLVRWESVLLLVAATAVGWGLVIDTTGAGKGLSWLGYLLEPLGLGGRDGEWAYANLGVPVALVIGFVGYLLLGSRAVRRQEHEQVVAGVRAEQRRLTGAVRSVAERAGHAAWGAAYLARDSGRRRGRGRAACRGRRPTAPRASGCRRRSCGSRSGCRT